MSLPFNNLEKREYQCFSCGMMFPSFNEYNNHISSEHEEGRDFIRCPITYCKACVRDLSAHFKAKHKGTPMPKVELVRAIIWHDFTSKGKKTRKPKFKTGWFTSTKMLGKTLHYRSGMEKDTYLVLDAWSEVYSFDSEVVKIDYLFEGNKHEYIPDIFITFVDGTQALWEIKPANQTALPINQAKWAFAEQFCAGRGWKFEVINEQKLNQLKKKVKYDNAQ